MMTTLSQLKTSQLERSNSGSSGGMEQISTSISSKIGLALKKTFKKISSLCMKEWKALKFKHKNLNASKILTKYGATTTLTKQLTSKLSSSSATQKKDYAKKKKKSTSGLSSNI